MNHRYIFVFIFFIAGFYTHDREYINLGYLWLILAELKEIRDHQK